MSDITCNSPHKKIQQPIFDYLNLEKVENSLNRSHRSKYSNSSVLTQSKLLNKIRKSWLD